MPGKSSHPALVWPRTDGDKSRWPHTSPPKANDWYFEEVPDNDPKYQLYEQKTAEGIVKFLGLTIDATKQRIPLPEGYKIYAHRKKQPDGSLRTDFYVFGSSNALRFRSTREFEPHAIWLFDTSKSILDHSQCGCPYSKAGKKIKARQSLPATPKRPLPSASSSPAQALAKRPKTDGDDTDRENGKDKGKGKGKEKERVVPVSEPRLKTARIVQETKLKEQMREQEELEEDIQDPDEDTIPSIVPDRATELTQGRRFRKGELVWYKINTIVPSDEPPESSDVRPLTHWPGLISTVELKVRTVDPPGPSSKMPQMIVQYYAYHIRPLGIFSPYDEVIMDPKDMIPWIGGGQLNGGPRAYDAVGQQAMHALRKDAKKHAEEIKKQGKSLKEMEKILKEPPGWGSKWAKKIKFTEMKDWEMVVTKFAFALRVAGIIGKCWTLTDRIEPLEDDPDLSDEDLKALKSGKKIFYQGLFWGGERIWLEDMVRLKADRKTYAQNQNFPPPSKGASERGVTMRISKIEIERNPNSRKVAFNCMLYGDLYEISKLNDEEMTDPESGYLNVLTGEEGSGQIPAVFGYHAPEGYAYRQLNSEDSETMCEISDLAGRIHPDFLDADKQNWYMDPKRREETTGRLEPNNHPYAIMGLRPGSEAACHGTMKWKRDLIQIVQDSPLKVEEDMMFFYVKSMREVLGLPVPGKGSKESQDKEASDGGGNNTKV
ncbi:hypothetical protein J008_01646 [Cryptococcus neoformans]|nr:hypothetical protein C362_01177 [Cryptococcus neoformans var. grubii Bt1]OXH39285.1 hypothetical protein J008_01646 [Cryptococcus neoformans var. grubii]